MPGFLQIACSCGCENRIPVERRGETVRCVACGNKLIVVADASVVDADDAIIIKPPAPVPAATIPAGFVKPAARSPFEDEPVNEVPGLGGRFTNYAPPVHEYTEEHCSRCGVQLRGEWDRLETSAGVLCYNCANQGADGTPERLKHKEAADNAREVQRPRIDPSAYAPVRLAPWWMKYRARAFQAVIFFGAGLFLLVAFTLTIFDIDLPIRAEPWTAAAVPTPKEINELEIVPWTLFQGWLLISTIVPVFVAVYLTLWFNGTRPKDRFAPNLRYAASLCLPLLVFKVLALVAVTQMGRVPVFGILFIVIVAAMQAVMLVYIAFELLDEGVWHCVYFILMVVAAFVAMPYVTAIVFQALSTR